MHKKSMSKFVNNHKYFKNKVFVLKKNSRINFNKGYIILHKNHWTCFFQERSKTLFFDSLGRLPCRHLIDLFMTTDYLVCDYPLQGENSKMCGQFCLYFLHLKIKYNLCYNDILDKFFHDVNLNEKLVKKFYVSFK